MFDYILNLFIKRKKENKMSKEHLTLQMRFASEGATEEQIERGKESMARENAGKNYYACKVQKCLAIRIEPGFTRKREKYYYIVADLLIELSNGTEIVLKNVPLNKKIWGIMLNKINFKERADARYFEAVKQIIYSPAVKGHTVYYKNGNKQTFKYNEDLFTLLKDINDIIIPNYDLLRIKCYIEETKDYGEVIYRGAELNEIDNNSEWDYESEAFKVTSETWYKENLT